MKMEAHRTPIQSFYAGQTIFITGGTGFLGKILIEKLLRSCPDISTIYILIRSKKDKNPERRLDEMFNSLLYDRVKKEVPNFRKKVVPIVGDLEIENLGLSENDKNILIHKVSIIFHAAANIRFTEKLKLHIQVNICGTNTILSIVKLMPNLKSFIYVSTAYSNFNMKHIGEHVYTYPINYKDIISFVHTVSENEIEEKMTKIVSQWPNTYTFTKAMAEGLLKDEGHNLPIGIFRPAIVSSSAREPLVGWNDNFFSEVGVLVSIISGFQRFVLCDPSIPLNFVPVDHTVNAIIASAWDVFTQFKRGKDMLVYNFAQTADEPTLGEWLYKILDINETYPIYTAQWLPFVIISRGRILPRLCIWLYHLLPALLIDTVSICMNRRPRLWELYRKIHNTTYAMAPFITRRWIFSCDNVEAMWNHLKEQDRQLFMFYMKKFDWTTYFVDHFKGIRFFLLNEDDSTLEISRIRYKRLYWIHQTCKTLLIFVAVWIAVIIFLKLFT
ncbi:PREDICTED: putative fatty acyl-CoA reductase CG5065 isoform X3 [Vollenhovia emeryi]|uniref:putative fatty acyl-CoA reductase CG5065 isoform X3 n=1 Tax=Vollenhovia emeryi TaxID=411798 RepID=UPI0005F55C09|nr:PREDICTED: putative fatty acyl-CoA reductase CG5065 isoform X3 [Vollenhovia emeryi]